MSGCTKEKPEDETENENDTNGENRTETTEDPKKFYGTWNEENAVDFESGEATITHIYYANGTYNFEMITTTRTLSEISIWELDNGTLITTTSQVYTCNYSFFVNYSTLTLIQLPSEDISILTK